MGIDNSLVHYGWYRPHLSLHQKIRMSNLVNEHLTDEQLFDQSHLAVLFTAKVFSACREAGITPTATGELGKDLPTLLAEAEQELGLTPPPEQTALANKWKRWEWEWEALRRRRYCYSFLLRVTSGGIVI